MAWDKIQMRREMGARLELTGQFSDADIAAAIGLTPAGYAQMKTSPEYIQIRNAQKYGILTELDASMGDFTDQLKKKISDNLPIALTTIVELAKGRDAVALKAAQTMVEMDGRLAPVRRQAITIAPEKETSKEDNDMAGALLAALKKHEVRQNAEGDDTVTIQ